MVNNSYIHFIIQGRLPLYIDTLYVFEQWESIMLYYPIHDIADLIISSGDSCFRCTVYHIFLNDSLKGNQLVICWLTGETEVCE